MNIRAWVSAIRLRTLPLALASIGMGSFLAAANGFFQVKILVWAAITTIFLQVLSNLANDYGDSVNGADSSHRVGPQRAVQSGVISLPAMQAGMLVFGVLSFITGIVLLAVSVGLGSRLFYWFLAFGVLSIAAAYSYTAGRKPYGYAGLGDLAVLVFFGFLGVGGTYFLYSQQINYLVLLPAYAMGALATGVLNINNMRDVEADSRAGKHTIPVRFGRARAVGYHWFLLLSAIGAAAGYVLNRPFAAGAFVWLLGVPFLLYNGYKVTVVEDHKDLDPYLKQLALSSLLFMLLFGLAITL